MLQLPCLPRPPTLFPFCPPLPLLLSSYPLGEASLGSTRVQNVVACFQGTIPAVGREPPSPAKVQGAAWKQRKL